MDRKAIRAVALLTLFVSLFVIFFAEPFLRWSWEFIVSRLSNKIYSQASMGQRNWVIVLNFVGLLALFASLSFLVILKNYFPGIITKALDIIYPRRPKAVLLFDVVAAITIFVSAFFLITSIYSDLQLNTSFEQRTKALAPYISQQEEEEIRSMWATMENRQDFEKIVSRMENIAKEKNVKLTNLLLE